MPSVKDDGKTGDKGEKDEARGNHVHILIMSLKTESLKTCGTRIDTYMKHFAPEARVDYW